MINYATGLHHNRARCDLDSPFRTLPARHLLSNLRYLESSRGLSLEDAVRIVFLGYVANLGHILRAVASKRVLKLVSKPYCYDRIRTYLVVVSVVEILPVNETIEAGSVLLNLLSEASQLFSRQDFKISALDSDVKEKHDNVLFQSIEAKHITTLLDAVLREDRWNRLKHALSNEVRIGRLGLPFFDHCLMQLDDLPIDTSIVCKSHREPDVTGFRSALIRWESSM
jgi:hypothetical protein